VAVSPDRPDFTDLAAPSDHKALSRLADKDSSTTTPNDDESGKRGLSGSVIGALLVPGAPSLFRRTTLSAALLLLGVVIPIATIVVALVRRNEITSLLLNQNFLYALQTIAGLFVLTRLVSVVEVIRSRTEGSPRGWASTLAIVGVMLVTIPAVWSIARAQDLSRVINDVFVSSGGDAPLAGSEDVPTSVEELDVPTSVEELDVPTSVEELDVPTSVEEFKTILLLGGDEGPGRWALRTDTMILVTIHEDSGRIAMISIPRNMYKMQFPPGSAMANEFPKGFPELANAIYPYVTTHEDIRSTYVRGDLQPEAIALASAISYSMDITIDDYVLVNMQGFLEVVDALGGVTLTLDKKLPMPGNVPGAKTEYPRFIGPGKVTMDGTTALGFVRSRSADSDYGRMGRQRQLLTALVSQVQGSNILLRFPALTDILRWTVRTSLSPGEFSSLVDRLRSGVSINESVGLIPPFFNPGNPNFTDIANLIDALQISIRDGVDFPYA
jgi:LCP family protein required for cell wall assembly